MSRIEVTPETYAPPTVFGRFLYQELLYSKLYVQDFAERIGLPRGTLVRLLETEAPPSLDVLLTISARLRVNFLMLVVLARPEHAEKTVAQQRAKPGEVETRLVASHLLPADMEDSVKTVLAREFEGQIYDALTALDSTMQPVLTGSQSQKEKKRLMAIHDRNIRRILNVLGAER